MAVNINQELFKRYAPKKKMEIINNLTITELLATTPETLLAFASRAMGKKLNTIEDLNDAVSDSDGFSFHEIKVVND